ncbi:VWA domain-containing protein [Leucothrix sargassi]|nr:VWA domain-containing protein [Leucothrix sargassi]
MLQQIDGVEQKDTHIVFLCDASGSMTGDRLTNMNDAIRAALQATQTVITSSEQHAHHTIDVSAIRFSDHAQWHTVPSKLHEQFVWDELEAPQGITNLGQAYTLLDNWLNSGAVRGSIDTLIVVLITDGMPTDEPSILTHWQQEQAIAPHFDRIAFALGSDAESAYLDDFVSHEDNLYILRNESMLKDLLSRALAKRIKKLPAAQLSHH